MVDIEGKVKELEKMSKQNLIEHKEIVERLNKKDIADALMRQQLDTLVITTSRIEQKIDEQNEQPKKRWDIIISTLISTSTAAIAGAIIGYIIK